MSLAKEKVDIILASKRVGRILPDETHHLRFLAGDLIPVFAFLLRRNGPQACGAGLWQGRRLMGEAQKMGFDLSYENAGNPFRTSVTSFPARNGRWAEPDGSGIGGGMIWALDIACWGLFGVYTL